MLHFSYAGNKEPCVEDELLPVDTTAKPIEEDDEGEEYCEDDDLESLEVIEITTSDEFASSTFSSTEESESTESTLNTDELMLSDSTYSSDSTQDLTSNPQSKISHALILN